MTLTLVIGAIDGFLALADGLRTKGSSAVGTRTVLAENDVKIVAVPHLSAVVLSSGRATYGDVHVSIILGRALADSQVGDTLEAAADTCAVALRDAGASFPSVHDGRLLIVGYDAWGVVGALQVDVPPRDFGDGLKNVRAVKIDPAMPVLANPADTDSGSLILLDFDAYADFLDGRVTYPALGADAYRFSGMQLSDLRPAALHRVAAWLATNQTVAAEDGIGGLWTVAEVRPGMRPRIETEFPLP